MLRQELRNGVFAIGILVFLLYSSSAVTAEEFHSGWPENAHRVWIGPQYWANRLQDWRISNGRLECITSGENRRIISDGQILPKGVEPQPSYSPVTPFCISSKLMAAYMLAVVAGDAWPSCF